jgi:hypothetical protein
LTGSPGDLDKQAPHLAVCGRQGSGGSSARTASRAGPEHFAAAAPLRSTTITRSDRPATTRSLPLMKGRPTAAASLPRPPVRTDSPSGLLAECGVHASGSPAADIWRQRRSAPTCSTRTSPSRGRDRCLVLAAGSHLPQAGKGSSASREQLQVESGRRRSRHRPARTRASQCARLAARSLGPCPGRRFCRMSSSGR